MSLRVLAVFEAAKGALVFLAGWGVLALVHRDAQALAGEWIGRMHLNPASRFPRVFMDLVESGDPGRWIWLGLGAWCYAVLRGVEAYGLWHERAWAEGLAVVSCLAYLPFEILELAEGAGRLGFALLAINLAVAGMLLARLVNRARRRAPGQSSGWRLRVSH